MPRTKDLNAYPEAYWRILDAVGMEGQTYINPVPTLRDAQALRGHWYAFVGALKVHRDRIRKELDRAKRPATSYEKTVIEQAESTGRIAIHARLSPNTGQASVTWSPRDQDWAHQMLLRGHFVSSGPVESPTEDFAAESLAKFLAKKQTEPEAPARLSDRYLKDDFKENKE